MKSKLIARSSIGLVLVAMLLLVMRLANSPRVGAVIPSGRTGSEPFHCPETENGPPKDNEQSDPSLIDRDVLYRATMEHVPLAHDMPVELEASPAKGSVPWDDAASQIKAKLQIAEAERNALIKGHLNWPSQITADWVVATFGRTVDSIALGEIEAIGEYYNLQLEEKAHIYIDYLNYHIAGLWASGSYERGIGLSTGPESSTGQVHHITSLAYGGWGVLLAVPSGVYSDLDQCKSELRALRNARNRSIAEFLNGG